MERVSNESSSFIRYGDQRAIDWPLMETPLPLMCIIAVYLMTIYRWGPAYMEKRKPYDLKWVMAIYNLLQVVACCYLIHGIITTDDTRPLEFWKCKSVDFRPDPKPVRILQLTYHTFLLKGIELIETVFFVLRKKQNQVSKLHVYHHVSTVTLSWIMVKYNGGGMILFSIVLNSFVHVIMYCYYFAALFGPAVQNKLQAIKKNITIIQMIQFCFILSQCVMGLAQNCDIPKVLIAIYVPNVTLIFYMFYDFFKTAYTKKSDKSKGN